MIYQVTFCTTAQQYNVLDGTTLLIFFHLTLAVTLAADKLKGTPESMLPIQSVLEPNRIFDCLFSKCKEKGGILQFNLCKKKHFLSLVQITFNKNKENTLHKDILRLIKTEHTFSSTRERKKEVTENKLHINLFFLFMLSLPVPILKEKKLS